MGEARTFFIPQKMATDIGKLGFTYPGFSIQKENIMVKTVKYQQTFRCALVELSAEADFDWLCTQLGLLATDAEIAVTIPDDDTDEQPLDVHVLYGRELDERSVNVVIDMCDTGKPFLASLPAVCDAIDESVTYLAHYSGLRICVHVTNTLLLEPDPECKNTFDINIVIGSSPPGEFTTLEQQYHCGVQLHPKRYWVRMNGPTLGRGTVLATEDEGDFGQMSGNVIWLFAPNINKENMSIFDTAGGDLLGKLMRLVSRTLAYGVTHAPDCTIESPNDLAQFGKKRHHADIEFCKKQVDQADKNAKNALENYRVAIQERRSYLNILSIMEAQAEEAGKGASAAFTRIRDMPLTHRIMDVDGALHIETNRVISKADGRRYDCGRLIIRIAVGGKISIWSIEPTHPKGIAHPHISPDGAICFGNVGPAIAEAQHENRTDDAVELIYDWLEDGYDENLATIKITEWPESTEDMQ